MPPFRFLDLAPELRNHVYEHALTHNRSKGLIAATGLLRTNRQIHDECKQILHAQSTFTITAKASRKRPGSSLTDEGYPVVMDLRGDMEQTFGDHGSTLEMCGALPPQVLALPQVYVAIDLDEMSPNWSFSDRQPYFYALNRFFFALANCLNSDGRPRQLEIFTKGESLEPILMRIAFWPLRIIQPRIQIECKLDLGPRTESSGSPADDLDLTAVSTTEDSISRLLERRLHDSEIVPLVEYRRLHNLNETMTDCQNSSAQHLGYSCLHVASEVLHHVPCWEDSHYALLVAHLIVASSLMNTDEEQNLRDITQPPEWLTRCFAIVEPVFGTRITKIVFKQHFKPLSGRVIDALVKNTE